MKVLILVYGETYRKKIPIFTDSLFLCLCLFCRSATSEEVASITGVSEERFSRVGTSPADLHGMWYPTVRRTLMCLFKLYRCVDRSIFQVGCRGVIDYLHKIYHNLKKIFFDFW